MVARQNQTGVKPRETTTSVRKAEKQIFQQKTKLVSWVHTMCVVPVSTLSMGEDSEQSFQHQREGVGQQWPENRGQSSAWGSQSPLRGWDDCPHGFAEVARAQNNRGGVEL